MFFCELIKVQWGHKSTVTTDDITYCLLYRLCCDVTSRRCISDIFPSCHQNCDSLLSFSFITARKRSLGQGNIFTPVCHSVHRGCVRGCSRGGCVVAPMGGWHAWLLQGGVVALGGCVVAAGGCAWLLPGGGMCGIWRDTEIRSMSGRYASYWNAFLFNMKTKTWQFKPSVKMAKYYLFRFNSWVKCSTASKTGHVTSQSRVIWTTWSFFLRLEETWDRSSDCNVNGRTLPYCYIDKSWAVTDTHDSTRYVWVETTGIWNNGRRHKIFTHYFEIRILGKK